MIWALQYDSVTKTAGEMAVYNEFHCLNTKVERDEHRAFGHFIVNHLFSFSS